MRDESAKKGGRGQNHIGTRPGAMDLPKGATKGLCAISTVCSIEAILRLPVRPLQGAGWCSMGLLIVRSVAL